MSDLENSRYDVRPNQVDVDMHEPTWQAVEKVDADGLIPLSSDVLAWLQSRCSFAELAPPETTIYF